MEKTKILQIVILSIILIVQGCGVEEPTSTSTPLCNGTGTITYSNSIYVGECKDGKKEGHGILTFNSGGKYDGEWKDDKKEGKGVYYYANGAKYYGEWKNGSKEGKGKYITQYGIYSGIWVDNKLTEVINQDSYQEAYNYFNKIRKQAGMIELEENGILQESAQSHSNYITIHDDTLTGLEYHSEERGEEGFTGVKASDRAISQGYFSRNIGEGISHSNTAKISINGLMTAIYHRFGILDFTKDEVGVGFTQDSKELTRNFVHNTGNSKLNDLCENDNYISGKYYYKVCADLNHKIESEDYNNAKNSIKKLNPKYVLWPSDNSVGNLYKFNGETPDPIPDYNQTGNPISIQFNDYYYPNNITMLSFKLFKNNKEITQTRILKKDTDPNKYFSEYQFALFPLEILDRDTTYTVNFEYKYNGITKDINWSFKTMK